MQTAIIGTSVADSQAAETTGMWNAGSCHQTVRKVNSTKAVVNVQSNEPHAVESIIAFLTAHKARVTSGIGGNLSDVVGVQFYIEADTAQIDGICRDIVKRFPVTPPVEREEDFNPIDKWVANYVVNVFVYQDREGVLADVFDIFRGTRVNAVSMHAATGPTTRRIDGPGSPFRYWGRVTINAYIPSKAVAVELEERLAVIADEVSVTPVVEQKVRDTIAIQDISQSAGRRDVIPAADWF